MSEDQRLHWEAVKLEGSKLWLLFIKMESTIQYASFNERTKALEVRCSDATYKASDIPKEIQEVLRAGDFCITVKSDARKSFYDVPVSLSAN